MVYKFVDALKNKIFIGDKDVFSYCEDAGVDCGLDSDSRANGIQVFVTDEFIDNFNRNISKLGPRGVKQLIDRFGFCFSSLDGSGLLTPSHKRAVPAPQFNGDNAVEVRIGRAADFPWRTVQSKPKDGKICLTYLFYDHGDRKEENAYFNRADKFFKDSVDLSDYQSDLESVFDGLDLSSDEREAFNPYKYRKDFLDIVNKYIEERDDRISELHDAGFNGGDITDYLLAELIPSLFEEFKPIRITEALLNEANRQQLLQKSRNAQNYSIHNQDKGKNRYERRNKSSISATVKDYNMIQMDPLFKRDILEFRIPVMGETDVYVVDVRVDGLLEEVRKQVMANKGKLEFKVILQSLMKVLNIGNVYIGCSCPDSRYRMAYWQTQDNYRAGYKERRPSNITNPNDTLGAGCKHVMLILANLDWAVKVASVINNYIKWCKEHMPSNYADYIFPKVYGTKYDKAVQLQLFGDTGLFPSDVDTMKQVIDRGMRGKDVSGRFSKGNEMRFQKKDLETPPEDNPDQMHIDFDGGQDDGEGGSGE